MSDSITITAPRATPALFDEPEIRVEGRDKVSGRMQYTADTKRPNMLWAAFATSPFAHARIVKIDTRAAKAVPGVKAVLVADDIGRVRQGRYLMDWPVLAFDTVRFIGDRVAAVAAETREAAAEAARLIDVEYEELAAVFDAPSALAPGAPVLHTDPSGYYYQGKIRETMPHPNLQGYNLLEKGDGTIDAVFERAYRVFERSYTTPRHHCGFLEPHATLVWIDDDGTVHVQSPNKSPFKLRAYLAHMAGIKPETVIVEPTAIGGDFGGKGLTIDEYPCYFLAKATGRPVRYVQTYVDELQTGATRHRSHITLRTAVDRDGTFLAHISTVDYEGGAYAAGKPGDKLLPGQLGYSTVGYQIPHARLNVRCAYTNTLPAAHVRAPSDVQIFFAWEQHVEEIAAALGIDSLELRLRNVMRDGDTALTGEAMVRPMGLDVLRALKADIDAAKPTGPGRGRGISFVCRHTGGGKTSLRLALGADGAFRVVVGVPDQGSGSFTMVRRSIAVTLDVAPERIGVRRGATNDAETDPGSGASRVTHIVGGAAYDAAVKMRDELEARTCLRIRGDRFVDDATGRSRSFEDVAAELCAAEPIEVTGTYDGSHDDPAHPADYSFSAFSIDVAVDRDTGAFKIENALIVTDVGQVINPIGHQGQIDGGFVYGIGGALMEEMPIDESGKVTTLSLGEYKMPTIADIPPLRTILIKAKHVNGPYGAKMAGELSNSGVAPAVMNAIHNAVGIRLNEFPITSERVYHALQEPTHA
jgi:CO/xanthine dehydrogenase Mo-binding subunit